MIDTSKWDMIFDRVECKNAMPRVWIDFGNEYGVDKFRDRVQNLWTTEVFPDEEDRCLISSNY